MKTTKSIKKAIKVAIVCAMIFIGGAFSNATFDIQEWNPIMRSAIAVVVIFIFLYVYIKPMIDEAEIKRNRYWSGDDE